MNTHRPSLLSLFALTVAAWAAGCGSDAGADEQVLIIEPYLAPCFGLGPGFCMLVTEEGSPEPTLFHDGIDGFTFAWAHRQQIRVEVTEIPDPPADGSSLRYELIEVIDDEVVDERFELTLSAEFIAGDPGTGVFSLLSVRDVTCAEAAVCDAIAAAVTGGEQVVVELAHGASESEPLVAHRADPL